MNERLDEPNRAEDCLADGGEMGSLMRAFDWSKTPLGPVKTWPQSLCSVLNLSLNTDFPICIYWGSDLLLLYNDAWSPILGTKHPWALGRPAREAWSEIWDIIGPLFEQVIATAQATRRRDQLLPMRRHGYTEECYFDYTFSPIRGEGGNIAGVFNAVVETTGRVVGERRLKTLRDLGAQAGQAKSAEEAASLAMRIIAENPVDIPFALLYLVKSGEGEAELCEAAALEKDGRGAPRLVNVREGEDGQPAWPLEAVLRTGEPALVSDLYYRFGEMPGGPWPEHPHQALILPLREASQGKTIGFVIGGVSPYRALDDDYRSFFGLVASHTATAIANARAFEEEKRRAEALAELDRAKTVFFSNVSHEFRTPLTLMLGPVEEALARAADPEQRAQLELAHRNALRLQKLVNTLLDFSRIEAGRIQACFEPTDLAGFTAELASVFRSAVERAGMRLIVACETLPEPVYVDRDMWEKIVLNLVSNAFKFTLDGEIEVSLTGHGEGVELRVRDTGTGISEEHLPRIFDRFHRIEGTVARTHEGTGIGLAFVQELTRLHGGTVEVESVAGQGTTFAVTVPLGTAHLPAERIGAERTAASTGLGAAHYVEEAARWLPGDGRDREADETAVIRDAVEAWGGAEPSTSEDRPRILLADDNADLRDYVARLLSGRYDVEAVGDGEAALEAARRSRPELILTDVMMPKLDGFGLLRGLRSDSTTRTIPVVMLSARAGEEARVGGLEAGADDYLIKPFGARELLARVSSQLELARVRREAASAVDASEYRFRMLFESMDEGYCIIEVLFDDRARPADYRFLDVNPAFEKQTGLRDAKGKRMRALAPGHEQYWFDIYGRIAAARETIRFENQAAALGRWYDVCAFPIGPAELRQVGIIFNDITERKRAEAERERLLEAAERARESAEAANRMKDEFLATLSHELRTPLNAILGWAKMLGSGRLDAGDIREGAAVIERNSRAQAQLIEDLLDVSRIISGKMTLDVQRVRVQETIDAAVTAVTPAAEAKGVRLHKMLDSLAGPVAGDPTRIQQIVWNLLSNAVKFTPKGGKVQVLLERVNSHVEISVIDTGIGISPDFLPYVFERFRQADGSTTRRHGGLGLGLAIAKQLAEMHGGTVRAKSPGEGQGATFTVTLPITIVHAEKAPPKEPERREMTHAEGLLAGVRVLVVDDEPDARQLIHRILADCHADVVLAGSADEAMTLLGPTNPDVLLSDIGMPEKDGYDLIGEIRDRLTAKELPAAALTAFARSEDRRRAMLSGFQTHVTKPVDPDELIAVVASLAGRTGRR